MGKPLGSPAQNGQPAIQTSIQGNGVVDASGRKIVPDIDVKNLRSQRQGERLLVKGWVFNNSSDQIIRIDTSCLLKQKRQHNQEINPGSSRELTLYDGPVLRNENERTAQIAYRLKTNQDVFMENYRVEYNLESDGTYTVEDFHDDGPVRDI